MAQIFPNNSEISGMGDLLWLIEHKTGPVGFKWSGHNRIKENFLDKFLVTWQNKGKWSTVLQKIGVIYYK